MSIWKKIKRAFGGVDDALEDSVKLAIDYAEGQLDEVVAVLKKTPVGTAVANIISAVDNDQISGSEKFARAVDLALPHVRNVIKDGGFEQAIDDAKDLTRQLVQSSFNDWKASGLKQVIKPLVTFLKTLF